MSETLTAQSDFDVPKGDKDELFALLSAEKRHAGYPDIDMLTENVNDIDFSEVDFSVRLMPEVRMPLPILGAAMNTVSGAESAKATGRQGAGMILHHANTPEEQKKVVREVKLDLNGVIEEPRHAYADETIESLLNREGHHKFRTFPVINRDGKYVGLVTKQLLNLSSKDGTSTPIEQVMMPADAEQTVPQDTDPTRAYDYMLERKAMNGKLVRINEEGEVTGLFLEPDVMRQVKGNPDRYLIGDDGRYVTFASVSPNPESAYERVDLMRDYLDYVFINTSHGENMRTFNTLSALQNLIRTINHDHGKRIGVFAGNISTWQTAQALAKAGPAGVIIGQGPGSACDSHNRLGYGTAQATAVYECAPAIKEVDPRIFAIADGAIREPADAIKAFGLGADMLIAGGLFAATDEAPMARVRMPDGSGWGKEYYGMGSEKAQREFLAARERYGHFDGAYSGIIFSEGKEMILPLKGPIAKVLGEFALGMRISMGSMGFRDIKNLRHGMSLRRG